MATTTRDVDSSKRTVSDELPEIQSILDSLKGITSIVMGLALTNTIIVLVTAGTYTHIAPLASIKKWSIVCAVAVVATIIRFYHGNNRFMDANYGPWRTTEPRGRGPAPRGGLGVDFLFIFGQSVIFALISFYASPRRELLLLFSILLVFDIFWYLITSQTVRAPKAQKHHRRWMLNNLGFGLPIIVCYFEFLQHTHRNAHAPGWLYAGAVLMACNTLVDFTISWDLYFGSFYRVSSQS